MQSPGGGRTSEMSNNSRMQTTQRSSQGFKRATLVNGIINEAGSLMDQIVEIDMSAGALTKSYARDWQDSMTVVGGIIDHILDIQREDAIVKYVKKVGKGYCAKWGCDMTMLAMRSGTEQYGDHH